MDKLSLGRQISSESCQADIAMTFLMVHEAVSNLSDTWLQSPHWDWDHVLSPEELQDEQNLEEIVEDAAEEVRRLAKEIYMALTGSFVIATANDPDKYEIPF